MEVQGTRVSYKIAVVVVLLVQKTVLRSNFLEI